MIKRLKAKYGLAIITVALLVIFRDPLINLYNDILVIPVFNRVQSNGLNDTLFFVMLIGIIGYYTPKLKTRYMLHGKYAAIGFIVLCCYFWERHFQFYWTFVTFKYITAIKYLDILCVPLLANIIIWMKYKGGSILSTIDLSNNYPKKGFELDEPTDNDKYERENLAKQIATRILNTKSDKSAFNIGVTGAWGSGKTSFLNLIKKNIKNSNPKVTIVEFNPWNTNEPSLISSDFFAVLASSLAQFSAKLSNDILRYSKYFKAIPVTSNFTFIQESIKTFNENDFPDIKSEINETLKALRYPVVVFIDDLDRLDKIEIIEVIRLIRNTANFGNLIFVAAYDKNYVLRAIKYVNRHNSYYFLEKIFQVEVPLPKFNTEVLRETLLDYLSLYVEPVDRDDLSKAIRDEGKSILNEIIKNKRDLIRFINSFTLTYDQLKGEVSLDDLIKLELIKLKFPKVYDLIYEKRNEFLELDKNVNLDFSGGCWTLKKVGAAHSASTILEEDIQNNHKALNINEADIKTSQKIVRELFKADWLFKTRAHLAINNPYQFYKYFHLGILKSAIPEKEFNSYRDKSKDDFIKKIRLWLKDGKTRQLIRNLNSITTFKSKDDFEKVLVASLEVCRFESHSLINHNRLFDLMHDDEKGTKTNKFYSGDSLGYKNFIYSIFINAPSPYLVENELIEYLIRYEREFPLTKDELIEISIEYLKKYLNEKPKFDYKIYRLTLNIINIEKTLETNGSQRIRTTVNKRAKEIFKSYAKDNDIEGFLSTITSEAIREGKKFLISWETANKLFDNYDGFEEFLRSLEETDLLKEYKQFFTLHKSSSFAPVEFDFKHLSIKARE